MPNLIRIGSNFLFQILVYAYLILSLGQKYKFVSKYLTNYTESRFYHKKQPYEYVPCVIFYNFNVSITMTRNIKDSDDKGDEKDKTEMILQTV